jgi:hypothetical protein
MLEPPGRDKKIVKEPIGASSQSGRFTNSPYDRGI